MEYRVIGHTTVVVTTVVEADSEEEAYDKAYEERDSLTAYCGNGGTDKLIGVDGWNESVDAPDSIVYDDIECLGEEE